MTRSLRILDAPCNLGLTYLSPNHEPGTRYAPDALRHHNLLNRIGAKNGGVVEAPPYSFAELGMERVRNLEGLVAYTSMLAFAVGQALDSGDFPLVLGGDCSILLGTTLALRQRGRYGLFYLDGHLDLQTGQTSRTGGAAGMDLALVTGEGVESLTTWNGLTPLVRSEDIVAFGQRDADEVAENKERLVESDITFVPLAQARHLGIEAAVQGALNVLASNALDGIWLHCDVDVLDSTLMPAVDSPQPDGLTYQELSQVLSIVVAHPLCVGMQFTIFDPDLDPTGQYAEDLVTMLTNVFTPQEA